MDDQKAFLAAAEKGLEDVIRRELQGRNRRLLIAAEDTKRRGAVHLAAKGGQHEVIRLLHDHGVLLEVLDCNGRTPLHLACEHGRFEAASILLERGCQADVQDTFGRTPLHLAVCSQDPSLCRLLLSTTADLAIRCDGSGRTPLAYAVLNSSPSAAEECTRMLLESSAEPNGSDAFGLAPLHYAAEGGSVGVAKLLLGKAADPLLQDPNSGRTPLEFAGNESMRDLLKSAAHIKQIESQSASDILPGDLQACPAFAYRDPRFQAMQSRFIHIMKDVQASSIQQCQHLARPFLFDGSWMAGVFSHQQLLGSELSAVGGPEACIRVFNLLNPLSQQPQATKDDEDIAAYYAAMWDGKDAGLADRLVKEQKDPRNDLTEELEEQKEALEFATVELQEGRRREMRLNMELQAALQDSADKVEKEARGEGTTLGHRVLRAGRQLAQKTEELRSAQALGQKLHRETTLLQDELQETKERSKELQVAQIEAQKRLEKELLRRGEEKSWKLIAEEDRHSAEVLRELLERRLEESEMATLQSRRSAEIFAEESQRWRMEEATEFQELRKHLAMEQAEAQRLKVSSEGVLAKAQLEIEARSAWYESEMRSAWRCEEREKQLAEQIEQGNHSRRVLEEEVVMLKEVARKRDAQWQEMFRRYPGVGQAFFGNAEGSDRKSVV